MTIFSTSQVARICKVELSMVCDWFDSGRLKGFKYPGSRVRRIPSEYLTEFMESNGMTPVDFETEVMPKVLILTQDGELLAVLEREIASKRLFRILAVASAFEAGLRVKDFRPQCVIVDFSIGEIDALQVCRDLRLKPGFRRTIIIGLCDDKDWDCNFIRKFLTEIFKKPFDVDLLLERLRVLIADKKAPLVW